MCVNSPLTQFHHSKYQFKRPDYIFAFPLHSATCSKPSFLFTTYSLFIVVVIFKVWFNVPSFYPLLFCSRAIWHSPHSGRQAMITQSSHTEPWGEPHAAVNRWQTSDISRKQHWLAVGVPSSDQIHSLRHNGAHFFYLLQYGIYRGCSS